MPTLMMAEPKQVQKIDDREVYQLFNTSLRSWAIEMPVTIYEPTEKEIFEKTPAELQYLINDTMAPSYMLDELGLAVIADLCSGTPAVHRASWSVATSLEWAEEQRDLYLQPAYKALRRAFGIDYHWILSSDWEDEWLYEEDTFLDEYITFGQQGKPEVWICDFYSRFSVSQ